MKILFGLAILIAGCSGNNSNNDVNDAATPPTELKQQLKKRAAYEIRPDNTYVELNTGKRVKLQYDKNTQRVTEQISNREIDYFIDEASHDTVDGSGRIVNHIMTKKPDGTYVASEDTGIIR
jgi:hypothetical protein